MTGPIHDLVSNCTQIQSLKYQSMVGDDVDLGMRVQVWRIHGGVKHTVRRPREIDPTNFNVETVLEAMMRERECALKQQII
jgi:hypothetical protein